MLLLRGETRTGEIVEFYFDDVIDGYKELGVTIVSWGDNVVTVLNDSVEAVAEDTDPMVE